MNLILEVLYVQIQGSESKMASSSTGTGSLGANGSEGSSSNDQNSQEKKQEQFDALRAREEGMQILKLFCVQKNSLDGPYNIWKIIVILQDCQMMRVRVFEYPNHKVYEFSDLIISHLKVLSKGKLRGNKLYFSHYQGCPPIFHYFLTMQIANRGRNFNF